jgi:transposase-like protein
MLLLICEEVTEVPRGRKKRKLSVREPGRPTDYRPEMCEQVQQWVQDGIVNHEIAARLGIVESTLYDWKNTFPEFAEAFEIGHHYRHQNVKNSLYKKCNGFEYDEVTKERMEVKGKNPEDPPKFKMVVTKKVRKFVVPSDSAIEFYLTNHLPDEYKHKSEVNNNINGSLGIRSDGMTNEQKDDLLRKQASKLQAAEG